MPKRTQGTQPDGNTKSRSATSDRSRKYCFTYNNYTQETWTQLKTKLDTLNAKYCIGEELGEKEQTPHLQGYVEFKNPIEFKTLKDINEKIHWEKCKGTTEDNIKYCTKDGKILENNTGIKPKRPLKEIILWQQWQFALEKIIQELPDDRTIHWFWDAEGGTGKTTMARYLCRKYGAIQLEGKKDNILHVAAENEADIYIYDIERSLESFISYGSIEKIKNGFYMSGKYEGKTVDRNPPHVIIFANFPPDKTKMSLDRWHIVPIGGSLADYVSASLQKQVGPAAQHARGKYLIDESDDSTESIWTIS